MTEGRLKFRKGCLYFASEFCKLDWMRYDEVEVEIWEGSSVVKFVERYEKNKVKILILISQLCPRPTRSLTSTNTRPHNSYLRQQHTLNFFCADSQLVVHIILPFISTTRIQGKMVHTSFVMVAVGGMLCAANAALEVITPSDGMTVIADQ